MATETSNRNHSATFPVDLPAWFTRLFTQPGDVVLDPFIGSGTTALAAAQLSRYYVGIDLNKEYVELARKRISHAQIRLPILAQRRSSYSITRSNGKAKVRR